MFREIKKRNCSRTAVPFLIGSRPSAVKMKITVIDLLYSLRGMLLTNKNIAHFFGPISLQPPKPLQPLRLIGQQIRRIQSTRRVLPKNNAADLLLLQ